MSGLTPFQTIGPFFHGALAGGALAASARDGVRIAVAGCVRDGAGAPVPDALLEFWQADGGFARAATDAAGGFAVETILPRCVHEPGRAQAPHLVVQVFARGILSRLLTRIYFEDQPENATDPILALVPEARRTTLIAARVASGGYRFDVVLQGSGETVFFDV